MPNSAHGHTESSLARRNIFQGITLAEIPYLGRGGPASVAASPGTRRRVALID
jgi:hypothetical protein